ncbi:MAG: hypothetical protein AB7G11_09315 [Phycisphaerales bacterium]
MAHDYYANAERIEAALREASRADVASQLKIARAGASTAGEALMSLRHECRRALRDASLPESIRRDLKSLVKAINSSGV